MEPVDSNSKELQELKSGFNDLKEALDAQRIVNKEFLEHIRKQKASFIEKDLVSRMTMDIITVPMILVVCNAIGWPMLFAAAVSVWAVADLISVLWMKEKFNMRNLFERDVLTVAKNVKAYKKFYHLSTVIGAVPAVAMTVYIIVRIYSQKASESDMLWIMSLLIVSYLVAVWMTARKYKKLMASCNRLIDSLENV